MKLHTPAVASDLLVISPTSSGHGMAERKFENSSRFRNVPARNAGSIRSFVAGGSFMAHQMRTVHFV